MIVVGTMALPRLRGYNKDFNKKTLEKVDCVCKQRKLSVPSGPLLPYLFGNFPAVPSKQIVLKCNKYWLGKAMARVSSGYLFKYHRIYSVK